jgi:DNA-binding MarR family transcriptional regulator
MEKDARQILECVREMNKAMHKMLKTSKSKGFMGMGMKELTMAQLETMAYLYEHKNVKMSELANHAGVKMSTMTDMIDRLNKIGLVERKHDEKDRRSITVSITKKLQSKVYGHIKDHDEQLSKVMDCLTKIEKQWAVKILTKMTDALHNKNTASIRR